jgi:hypothetical protein
VPKYIFGKPADQIVKTNPRLPIGLQRRMGRILPRIFSGKMEDFGCRPPTTSSSRRTRPVSERAARPARRGRRGRQGRCRRAARRPVRFTDGSVEQVDTIIYATGYGVTFPFFDEDFLSAPENRLPLFKRMFKPDIDDLAFIGLGQAIPTIFPFAELQSKLAARWLAGDWAPPSPTEMLEEIERDEAFHLGHFTAKPRHTMQLEWYSFEHELKTRSIPRGQERARAGARTGADLAGRADALSAERVTA